MHMEHDQYPLQRSQKVLHSRMSNSYNLIHSGTGSFLIPIKKTPKYIPAQSTLDPVITCKGDFWEMREIVKRKDCSVKMSRKTAADREVSENDNTILKIILHKCFILVRTFMNLDNFLGY